MKCQIGRAVAMQPVYSDKQKRVLGLPHLGERKKAVKLVLLAGQPDLTAYRSSCPTCWGDLECRSYYS